jgi:hypothetical protein
MHSPVTDPVFKEKAMALPIHVALVPEGVNIPMAQLTRVSAALSKQVDRDFQPLWDVGATVDAFAKLDDVPTDYWPIIVTHVQQGGGFHETKDGQPFALVDFDEQWSLTASHECLEMLADPFGRRERAANLLDQAVALGESPNRVNYLVEICDPCESGRFSYQVNGVVVSDFYTPNFFDPVKAPSVRYSFKATITAPLQILDGGYISWHNLETDEWMQLRMFPDEFSADVPHLLNLSKQTNFEKLRGKMSLREAVDRVTIPPPYRAGLAGPALTAAHVGASTTNRACAARAAALRREVEAILGSKAGKHPPARKKRG